MTTRSLMRVALAGAMALPLMLGGPAPASAQMTVFDPSNYAQNVLTAARTLQQIQNQVTALQNQAQMLINQARNLQSLPYSALSPITSDIQRTQQLLGQAQGVIYNVGAVQSALAGIVGGGAYANYIDPNQSDWATATFGANLPKLQAVATKYDPDRVFGTKQGINASLAARS